MADTKTPYPLRDLVNSATIAHAAFVGTGTNIAVAASTVLASADNYGYNATITDNGTGDFTVLFTAGPTRLLDVLITCTGPTVLEVVKTSQSITAAGLLSVRFLCRIGNGTATDPTTSDTIRITIFGSQSTV